MKYYTTLFAVAALMLIGSSLGFASPIYANGSFAFTSTGGFITYTPPSPGSGLLSATSVAIPIPNATGSSCGASSICEQINSILPTYNLGPNSFGPLGATPLAINNDVSFDNSIAFGGTYVFDLAFPAGGLPIFDFTFENGDRFQFVASSGSDGFAVIGGEAFLNVSYQGIFSDSGGTYLPNAAELSLTFTQTGGDSGTVGFAGSFATAAPEPTTLALLGSALVGLGLIRRRKA